MLESFVKTYQDRSYRFPTLVAHRGMVVAFAMDGQRRIRYATLALKPTDPMDVHGWPADPAPVPFPRELTPVGFATADPTVLPDVPAARTAPGVPAGLDTFLSSTARLGAAAPFAAVSDGQFVYLFRQAVVRPTTQQLDDARRTLASSTDPAARRAAQDVLDDDAAMVPATDPTGAVVTDADGVPIPLVDGRILVDRFVLVGSELQPKLEVRYQRSRNRVRPASRTDGLGAKDLEGRPFVEPTQELRFLPPSDRGRFAVTLTPTSVADSYRWQLFCADRAGGVLWSYSVEQGADGLFNTAGSQGFTCLDHPDVFSLVAGSCPRPLGTTNGAPPAACGKTLVPAVARDGAGGSALRLESGAVVQFDGAAVLGTSFTIEAWINADTTAGSGERILLGGGNDDAHSCPTLRTDGTAVRAGFGDGTALRTVTAREVLVPGTWQHLAASYNGSLLTVCVDGVPVLTSTDLSDSTPVGTAPSFLGAEIGGFTGVVDEVRLWNRPRAVEEIRSQLHLRQSGLEEGLVGYWRFDEGRGPTVWDQAGTATGAVGQATWTTSDAPIGLSRGVTRTALRIDGRVPTGGVAATVYFQQENAVGGYGTAAQRHKGAARMMLTAVTAPSDTADDPDAGRITALDFGIGADGRLSDLPTAVQLALISGPTAGGEPLSRLLDRIGVQEAEVAGLGSSIASTQQLITDLGIGLEKARRAQRGQLRDGERITGACADLDNPALTVDQLLGVLALLESQAKPDPAVELSVQIQLQAPLVQLSDGINAHQAELDRATARLTVLQRDLAAAQAQLVALRALVNGDVSAPMALLHVDSDGGTAAGAVLDFALARSAPDLFDSAMGTLAVYFRGDGDQLSAAYYDTFTGRARFAVPDSSAGVAFVPHSALPEFDALEVTVSPGADDAHCDLAIRLPGNGNAITETWHALPRDPAQLAAVLAGTAQPPGLERPYDYAVEATTTLPGARVSAGSRLLSVDARAASGPVPLGTAVLLTPVPSARWYGSLPGTTLTFDGQKTVAGLLDTTAVRLNGTDTGVALGSPAQLDLTGQITLEAWVRPAATDGLRDIVARGYAMDPDGEVFLRIADGQYQAGSWTGTDHVVAVPVPETDIGAWVHLAATHDGVRWQLYRNGVFAAQTEDPVGAVPVAAGWSVGMSAAGDRFFAGDIDDVRIWSGTRSAVDIADARAARLGGTEKALAGYWFVTGGVFRDHTTGHADGTFQGAPGTVESPPALTTGEFDVLGDVTVETWVKPEPGTDGSGGTVARLAQYRSASSSYVLGLRKVPSALSFNGRGQIVVFGPDTGPDVVGPITVEAWVLPTSNTGLRYVVAHGLDGGRTTEVALRINGDVYQFGSYDGSDHYVTSGDNVPAGGEPVRVADDLNRWLHLAGVYDGTTWRLYRDGEQIGERADATGAVPVNAAWTIGGSADRSPRFFEGTIGEVRVWSRPLAPQEIADDARAPRWAAGDEPGLVLCARHDGRSMVDVAPAHRAPMVIGQLSAVDGLGGAYLLAAGSGPQYAESTAAFPGHDWTHVAMVFEQDYSVHLATNGYLDAGTKESLNITGELTVEVAVQLDDLSAPHGLITRGQLGGAASNRVPYALGVNADGSLVFMYVDSGGTLNPFVTGPGVVSAGQLHRIAVVRRMNAHTDSGSPPVTHRSTDIVFVVDGAVVQTLTHTGPDPAASSGALQIGRLYGPDGAVVSMRGAVAEVRLWRKAVDTGSLGGALQGNEVGLVSWWRLAEGTGTVTVDVKGTAPASLRGAATWVKTPDPAGSRLRLYRDGAPVPTRPAQAVDYAPTTNGFALGRDGTAQTKDLFTGQLEELRIWHTARTAEQLQDNLFRRAEGEQRDLVAYYTFDGEPGERLTDQGPLGNTVQVVAGDYEPSTAPVGSDAPQVRNAVSGITNPYTARVAGPAGVAEYADLQRASDGSSIGVYKRCYGIVDDGGRWQLVTGFKVGDLTVDWVGQAQFDPQLVGFIEGPPPVPSENLTVLPLGYDGASAVTITQAATTKYTYASSRKAGIDLSAEATIKESDQTVTYLGEAVGLMELEAPLGVGLGEVEMVMSMEQIEAANIGATQTVSVDTSTSWLASSEGGQGETLTQASAMKLTCLQESPEAQEHPAVGPRWIPENVGMALVQSQTADVFALRLTSNGALVAYQMQANPDIPKDWNILIFPLDPRYTKAGVLDGKVGLDADRDYPAALAGTSDASYYKPIEAYQLKGRIDREEEELATYFRQFDAGPGGLTANPTSTLPTGVKRNLVNTYVWTSGGGSFAETRNILDSRSETTGGSFSFSFSLGAGVNFDVDAVTVDVSVELSAKAGAHLELEVSKTQSTDTDFGVEVELDPERDISALDSHGKRILQPGKVDAYRFMTFYLAPDADFHDLFFNQVVDPIWLAQSGDPAAAALRKARQDAQRPACWRVVHRVTFVSRILAEVSAHADPYIQALRQLDLNSNYELVKTLEPYVTGHTATFGDFRAAVKAAVTRRLPDLLGHLEQVTTYLAEYFGVDGAAMPA